MFENEANHSEEIFANTTMDRDVKEDLDKEVNIFIALFSGCFLLFIVIALVALNRTKTTPKTARFLSSALLSFDFMAIFCLSIRRFITHADAKIYVQSFGIFWYMLAQVTVVVMSVERVFLFSSPNLYLRRATPSKVQKCASFIWASFSCAFAFVVFGLCFLRFPQATASDITSKCRVHTATTGYTVVVMGILIPLVCYSKIFCIIRSRIGSTNKPQTGLLATTNSIHQYRATTLVLMYVVTNIVSSVAFIIVVALKLKNPANMIYASDAFSMFNCLMDPCMYVLWFKECRMEILKMIVFLNPNLHIRIEHMRREIFNIVLLDKVSRSHGSTLVNNAVHPIRSNEHEDNTQIATVGFSTVEEFNAV